MDIQWPLVLFTLFSGVGGALAVFAGIGVLAKRDARLTQAAGTTAIALALVGGLCSVAHLAHPLRAVAVVVHPAAGIFVEACLLGIVVVLSACMIFAARKEATAIQRGLAVPTMLAGVALAFLSGLSYVMPAHPAWNTLLLPLSYLTTALSAGGAIYCAIAAAKDGRKAVKIFLIEGVMAMVNAVSVLAYVFFGGILSSEHAILSLVAVVLSGVVPAAASFVALKKPKASVFVVAALSALVGSGALRVLMWAVFALGIPTACVSLM